MSARTAILISGGMRTFEKCLPNLHWNVFNAYPDASFYVSTVLDGDSWSAELLRKKYPKARIEIEVKPEQPKFELPPGCPPESSWKQGRPFMHEGYAISVPPQAVIGQLWQMENVWRLYERGGEKADTIIRCRPDLWFMGMEFPKKVIGYSDPAGITDDPRALRGPITIEDKHPQWKDAWTPGFGHFSGCNDRFAIMHAGAAKHYFETFSNMQRLIQEGCPLHPESLVRASLEWNGCRVIDTLKSIFGTLRKDGQFRPPEIDYETALFGSR